MLEANITSRYKKQSSQCDDPLARNAASRLNDHSLHVGNDRLGSKLIFTKVLEKKKKKKAAITKQPLQLFCPSKQWTQKRCVIQCQAERLLSLSMSRKVPGFLTCSCNTAFTHSKFFFSDFKVSTLHQVAYLLK